MAKLVLVICISTLLTTEVTSASCGETTEVVTTKTDTVCSPPSCNGPRCSIVDDPTGCTAPRCVCLPPYRCDLVCLPPKCPPGTTLYNPPSSCPCARCVCLPKRCDTCDPNNKTIPNFPTCQCSTCQCIDGECINLSNTTEPLTTL